MPEELRHWPCRTKKQMPKLEEWVINTTSGTISATIKYQTQKRTIIVIGHAFLPIFITVADGINHLNCR
jgi:hypothetical protein